MRFVASKGAAAKSHRDDAAGRGHPDRVVAGRGAVTELLLAGALLQNSIGKQPAGQPAQKTRQRKGAAQNSSRRKRAAGSEQQRAAGNAGQQPAH